nr:hypothetical protein [Endobacter medicaginis]
MLYIAEAYQCYHGALIGLELARRPGVRVVTYYNDPAAPAALERIRLAFGAPPMTYRRLERSPLNRALQGLRVLGMIKTLTLWENRAALDRLDAIVAVEDTVSLARRVGIRRPRLIYYPHGFGDRARGFARMVSVFDQVLVPGRKTERRMVDEKLVAPSRIDVVGPVKIETCERLRQVGGPLFTLPGPVVLYNAHKAPGLSSWPRFIEPILSRFAAQDEMNLIVAPHIKMFRRRRAAVRARWERRSGGRVLVDVSSERLLDMSYTSAADIYVGDVSSQVYEFLLRPRPCVFLNAARHDWRSDPNFAHWHLGDVVEEPDLLWQAIRDAPARHALYRERQQAVAQASLGTLSPSPAVRAADAILRDLGAG